LGEIWQGRLEGAPRRSDELAISPKAEPSSDSFYTTFSSDNETMAEGLGVAASVAGLIQLADIVVGRGYKFIKSVKDAEKAVKSLVHEVNNLSGVLHSLSNTIQLLEEDENEASFDPTTQVHYIESCYQTLTQIQRHFEAALPSSLLSTRDKFRWPLKQSQTKELLGDIQRHKSTMGLAMSATEM
jgi:hypothetical protein